MRVFAVIGSTTREFRAKTWAGARNPEAALGATTAAHGSATAAHGSATAAHGSATAAYGAAEAAYGAAGAAHGAAGAAPGATPAAPGAMYPAHGNVNDRFSVSAPFLPRLLHVVPDVGFVCQRTVPKPSLTRANILGVRGPSLLHRL
jgi:hypothetical protein